MSKKKIFVGIDVGTQGIRMTWVDGKGNEYFSAGKTFNLSKESRIKQDPEIWWNDLDKLFKEAYKELGSSFFDDFEIESMGVTSTSGTVIPLDKNNEVIYGAIMYSDPRSQEHSKIVSNSARQYYGDLPRFTHFNSSCGLSKMLWFKDNFKDEYKTKLSRFIHASDFITGKMTGVFNVTDHSNALKSGYDLHQEEWPDYITGELELSSSFFPEVKPIGTVLGVLNTEWIDKWKLPNRPKVCVGLTDGCASQIAAGAVEPGDWNTTIGTTLVLKGVTINEIYDKAGSIYCHKHPQGYWMPGGASNIGADWVHDFTKEEIEEGSKFESAVTPSSAIYYPLKVKGERFPFISSDAEGGVFKEAKNRGGLFQAGLEGVAYIERYAYEKIERISGNKVEKIYSAGGGNKNEKWLQIRANVLNKVILKSEKASGAMGAAIVAASHTYEKGITEAAKSLLGEMEAVFPDTELVEKFEDNYQEFIDLLKEKGYINE